DPAVIVDDGVADVIADSFALLRAGAGPIAGDLVPGPREPRQALGVHLQQITRAGPLKEPDLLTRRRRHPRQATTPQTAADGRVRHPELRRDQSRPPPRPLTRLTHPIV